MSPRITRIAAGAALTAALCAVPIALGAPSGAAFTTDATGTAVNQNHYASPDEVHLNGGPPCHASAHAAALPDGRFFFRVTTPNGKTTLSTAGLAERSFTVAGGRIVASTAETSAAACGGVVVKVGPFAESPNGVYKLWIVPASAAAYATFPARASKTDNFMVDPFATDPGGEDPPGGGGPEL